MKCPNCGAKLLKPDSTDKIIVRGIMTKTQVRAKEASVVVISEYDMRMNGKLTKKMALCAFCGEVVGEKEFGGGYSG